MGRRIIIGLIVLVVASCQKQEVESSVVENVNLNTSIAEVKSLVESSSELKTEGNKLTIYDVHTELNGELFQYMDAQPVEYRDGAWRFTKDGSVIDIPWTKQGVHHFLAYVSKYGEKTLPAGFSLSYTGAESVEFAENQKLTLSATITTDTQFDFMYASHARNVLSQGTGTVPLEMQHLFAAVQFRVLNMSGSNMTVETFALDGMRVTGSADIGIGNMPVLNLDEAPDDSGFDVSGEPIASNYGTSLDLHRGPFLIWPHSQDYYKDVTCTFSYKIGNEKETDPVVINLTAANPGVTSWDAGCRYIYTITISDHILFDVVRVVDWINDDVILKK